jgi:hypothetical protein
MALSPDRYTEVEAQLLYIHEYLVSLADQICQAAPVTDPQGRTHRAALGAVERIDELRYLLAVSEARRQIGERLGQVAGPTRGKQYHPILQLHQ